jgi:hypothetical protein
MRSGLADPGAIVIVAINPDPGRERFLARARYAASRTDQWHHGTRRPGAKDAMNEYAAASGHCLINNTAWRSVLDGYAPTGTTRDEGPTNDAAAIQGHSTSWRALGEPVPSPLAPVAVVHLAS